jgi:hypothetical protein
MRPFGYIDDELRRIFVATAILAIAVLSVLMALG